MTRVCHGCGTELPPKTWLGRDRKWCSERCRKRQYDLACVDCGGRVDGASRARAEGSEPVCRVCAPAHYATWTRDAIVFAIEEWADENGGIPPSATDFRIALARGAAVPNIKHVQWRFGSWNAAIVAAGFEPHAGGPLGGFKVLTPAEREEAARRYAAGESVNLIAADLKCAPATVRKWARKAGVEMRPQCFGVRKAAA